MRLTRVHAAVALSEGGLVELPPAAANHLARVLRLGPGAPVRVFDGDGTEHAGRIEAVRAGSVLVRLGARLAGAAGASLNLTLVQGISRAERMDFAVQKATELGATRIVPLKAEHAVVRLNAESAAKKRAHWLGVAIAASEQCGRTVIPEVAEPVTLPEWLATERAGQAAGLRLVLDPSAARGIGGFGAPADISLLVGPEGGLSATEVRLAAGNGYLPVRLGPRVLRTETEALAALAALQTLYGDLAG